jgi:hypothetical protein
MTTRRAFTLIVLLLGLVTATAIPIQAQTIDDGIMLDKGALFTGSVYAHDSWDEYWEGALKRGNGNIGTLTTETITSFANYGLTSRINVIGALPYVWTTASQGVLHGMQGVQDLTIAAKYRVGEGATSVGRLRAIAVVAGGIPLTDYTPDFQPLSIGMGSTRVAARFTVNLQSEPGWFVNGSTAYTWRSTVTLDRPYYFTNGQFFMTDEVDMPEVFDYVISGGYNRRGLMLAGSYTQQRVQGGGDIRRQDMPFVSNRMNFSRVGGQVMAPIPKRRDLAGQFSYAFTIDGRNVGQATTITAGILYTFHFLGRPTQ